MATLVDIDRLHVAYAQQHMVAWYEWRCAIMLPQSEASNTRLGRGLCCLAQPEASSDTAAKPRLEPGGLSLIVDIEAGGLQIGGSAPDGRV